MYIAAYIALLTGFLAALGAGGGALLQLWEDREDWLPLIKKAQWLVAGCALFASAALLHALFWLDFRVDYVASYTDALLPVFYRLTAFWAGQQGSLLFWALITALCGCAWQLFPHSRLLSARTSLWMWVFFSANMAFFLLLLTSWSNPFLLLDPAPGDGNGLNPLLRNPGMIFHPPLLFIGYAFLTVPACLAMASLASGGDDWGVQCRGFMLLGWVTLGAGIALGAWWAYMELGWGGYWAWDPVENASLLPWLCATAAMHLLAVKRRTGALGKSSAVVMAFALLLAWVGTWLTRSGVIQSVHAFGEGGVGIPLLIFIIASIICICWLSFTAKRQGSSLADPLSRSGALLLTAWVFLALDALLLAATLWPALSAISSGPAQGLDAAFYNCVCLPLGAFLILVLAVCVWLGWCGGLSGKTAILKLLAACGVFFASLGAIWVSGYHQPVALLAASGAIAALCSLCMTICRTGFWADKFSASAFGAHLGIAIIALGIAFSGPYSTTEELFLLVGEKGKAGPYEITLENIHDGQGLDYDYLKAHLNVTHNGREIGQLGPERRIYAKFGSMQFSEVDVISSLGRDIYASLLGVDEDHRVLVSIAVEPLVNWIWIGAAIMCLAPLAGLWRKKKSVA